MPYYAELDADNIVQRVIVAPDDSWAPIHLGGTWVRTADPYDPEDDVPGRYAGPGMGYDRTNALRFAPQWSPPAPPIPGQDEDDEVDVDSVFVFLNGRIRSLRDADRIQGVERGRGSSGLGNG